MARQSLQGALADRSPIVREAARKALEERVDSIEPGGSAAASLVNQESPP